MELRSGPCVPWVDGETVESLASVQKAVAELQGKGNQPTADEVAAICADSAVAASELLYELSGRMFTGECGPVKVRPVSRPTDVDSRAMFSLFGYRSSWAGSRFLLGVPAVASHFGGVHPPEVDLGAYPVIAVTEVLIDGAVIPPEEYALQDRRMLVRMRTSASATPTERWGWPTAQILDLPDTEQGTFSVSFTFGQPPPASGVLAVRKLAEFLALPQLGNTTKYPQRVTSVQRQGVSAMVVDVMDILKTGATGIYEVDVFLRSVNPRKLARQATVWSPDLGRPRRVPTI